MLDNLVESKSNLQSTTRRGGYLLTTGFLVFSLFASGILWSLFAKDLSIGNETLELSSIVPPVPMAVDEPPVPEVRPKQEISPKAENALPVRNANIARLDENQPIPEKVSTSPSTQMERPKGEFIIDPNSRETEGASVSRNNTGPVQGGSIVAARPKPVEEADTEDAPPVIKKAEPKIEKPVNSKPVSKGVINGTATYLPKPPYPPAAKAIRASGDVNVQVTIDEKGNVISASAISGHALLRQVSEAAARGAKFKPTFLSEVPVKVTGVIVYKFSAQ